jgi:hypothetical protein
MPRLPHNSLHSDLTDLKWLRRYHCHSVLQRQSVGMVGSSHGCYWWEVSPITMRKLRICCRNFIYFKRRVLTNNWLNTAVIMVWYCFVDQSRSRIQSVVTNNYPAGWNVYFIELFLAESGDSIISKWFVHSQEQRFIWTVPFYRPFSNTNRTAFVAKAPNAGKLTNLILVMPVSAFPFMKNSWCWCFWNAGSQLNDTKNIQVLGVTRVQCRWFFNSSTNVVFFIFSVDWVQYF